MNQSRGLKRMSRRLTRQLLRCQPTQFVVNQRQKLFDFLGVLLLKGGSDAGNFT